MTDHNNGAAKELVIYTRGGCPMVGLAKRVLNDYHVAYREIAIDKDDQARQWVLKSTGFLSVPTLVVANPGDSMPFEEPLPLTRGSSPRGINRGTMITEPTMNQLTAWLEQHGFIAAEEAP
jgi:glutaredoxin